MRAAVGLLLLLLLSAPSVRAASITARNYEFAPQTLDVAPGETITVTFEGEGHTFTEANKTFDTGFQQAGATATITAPSTPGDYKFYCQAHALPADPVDGKHMTGILHVRAATASNPPTAIDTVSATPPPIGEPHPKATTPGFGVLALALAAALALVLRRR